jgi:hypothetical protein
MRRKTLQCPFCSNPLAAPLDITADTLELTGGICTCGAVYALDRTGHNLGAIFMDALVFACKEDYDKALSLNQDEYDTETLDYDPFSNTASRSEGRSTKKIPKLFFVKLKNTTTGQQQ